MDVIRNGITHEPKGVTDVVNTAVNHVQDGEKFRQ